MFNVTECSVRRTAIALSILSLLGASGCSSMGADSGMGMKDPPMASMSMPRAAQGEGMMGQDHAMPPGMNMPRTPFSEAEMGMHRAMMMATDVNTQRTWARKMIAHHRGAIAMSQALLGSDATDTEIRRMAQAVIDTQTREVAALESWLERHPG